MNTKAFAKVNLALDILGTRDDGYHEMDMVNAPAELYDELEITPAAEDSITCDTFRLPANSTLHKAVTLMREQGGLKGHYAIHLIKHIPDQAGLGGGSADAAALLKALNEIESLGLGTEELDAIGFQIGADVPCCLHGGFTRVKGAGEIVQDLNIDWKIPVVLAQGVKGISTKEAFARFEETKSAPLDIDIVEDAVRKKDIGLLYQTMSNAFEAQAYELMDELVELREDMRDAGLVRVMMTGSGSVLMGFSVDEAVEELSEKYPFVWKGYIG